MENFIEVPRDHVKLDNIAAVQKDKGEVLFADIKSEARKFSRVRSIGRDELFKGMMQNISNFRDRDKDKYSEFLDKTENFPVIWKNPEVQDLEKYTDKRFVKNLNRLFILNELVEIEKLNLPQLLREIIEKHFKEGKMPEKSAIKTLMENDMTGEDYAIVERGLTFYNWSDVAYMMEWKDVNYEAVADRKKFLKIKESVGRIEKEYARKLKFDEAKIELHLLSSPEYIEKILSLKEQINELEEHYGIGKLEHIDEFENINRIKQNGELKDIFSDEFKEKMEKAKRFYYLDKFGSVKHLEGWLYLEQEKFEEIVSEEFSKKIGNLGEQIGRSKGEVIQFFAEENFLHIDRPYVKALLDGRIIFSNDVKEGKLDFHDIFNPESMLQGRGRMSGFGNVTKLATYGRPEARRFPYKGWGICSSGKKYYK